MIKTCICRTQLTRECKVKVKPVRVTINAEMIQLDCSIFGEMRISDKEILFSSSYKDIKDKRYRLGPVSYGDEEYINIKRFWKYREIRSITAQNYNMIRQAIEIRLKNRKTVIFVLFSE